MVSFLLRPTNTPLGTGNASIQSGNPVTTTANLTGLGGNLTSGPSLVVVAIQVSGSGRTTTFVQDANGALFIKLASVVNNGGNGELSVWYVYPNAKGLGSVTVTFSAVPTKYSVLGRAYGGYLSSDFSSGAV